MNTHPRKSAASSLNSPDEERSQSFDDYALNPEPYTSLDQFPESMGVFVPASELADTSPTYRHVASAYSSSFSSSSFVTDGYSGASYSSSPATNSFFGKQPSYSSSPMMMPSFGKAEFQSLGPQFGAFNLDEPTSESSTLFPAPTATADPFLQEFDVPIFKAKELYLRVNPSFVSKATPQECLVFFAKTLNALGFQYTIHQHWMIQVTGLLCVEEVTFSIALKRDLDKDQLVVDFILHQGIERNFLRLFDIVRNRAQSLDLQPSPTSASASSDDWLNVDTMPELFPGSGQLPMDTLLEYCEDYLLLADEAASSTTTPSTACDLSRLEMAACIKNAALSEKNRQLVLHSDALGATFGNALYRMAQDHQTSIVRYAVFILSLFDAPSLLHLASYLQVEGNMLSVLAAMETTDPIPKMQSIAAALRTKLEVASN
ncbi:Aste57867_23410 [Aphanomyces stellatus]|uniref:Aste57867_23410 protein n=1 Tax=Aphanomyces stellatus TaxID=120398 RepID=A0A485LNN3_9STRA|nr:hypothetical protein As57867_023339 [Aphanomyces stellatus]VFU00056.1 Aste57867_23410 [Aphanomyces stellatus]